jgi:cyclophilin family peptidyl-prolyl cis-trans isomerase
MANAGSGTDGSQFFLTFAPTQFLDSKHTLFGEIVNGVETMKALEKAGTGSGKTREPLVIGKTTIEVKPKVVAALDKAVIPVSPTKQDKEAAPVVMADDPALLACTGFIADQVIDKSVPGGGWKTRLRQPPMFDFDEGTDYFWKLSTNKGEITVKLWPDVAPNHVSSTMFLSEVGFYDGISFHRVIPGFMAQGGCPLGSGTGGPGYKYAGEFKPGVSHDRPYLLSMANAGSGTDGSQFFLTFVPTQYLDNKHTLFGEIVNGVETMKALEKAGTGSGRPRETLVIEKASIEVRSKGAG